MNKVDINLIKSMTLTKCKGCEGYISKGVRVTEKGHLETCECGLKFLRYLAYNEAGIEREYWDFNFTDLDSTFVKTNKANLRNCHFFLKHTQECILNACQFLFTGENGVGKTVVALLVAKGAIDKGFKVSVITAEMLSTLLFDKEYKVQLDKLDECDFLVIDEIDKFTGRNIEAIMKVGNKISDFIRSKSLILISNVGITELATLGYRSNFISRLESFEQLHWKGINFRSHSVSKFKELKDSLED